MACLRKLFRLKTRQIATSLAGSGRRRGECGLQPKKAAGRIGLEIAIRLASKASMTGGVIRLFVGLAAAVVLAASTAFVGAQEFAPGGGDTLSLPSITSFAPPSQDPA